MQFTIPVTPAWQISSAPIRLHGLDALRGIAAVLVVLLHSGIPYMSQPLTFLVWPARDVHPSLVVDGITWCTECFIMPLFFVLAGFFSNGLLISRGERNFLSGRTKRLLSTQLVAGIVILPVCLGIWSLGWVADGLYVPQNVLNSGLPVDLEAELYGVAHLWFLQNLYIYCLILCGISWLRKQVSGPALSEANRQPLPFRGLDNVLLSIWKPLFPAIPCAMILYYDTRIVLGFYQTFIPVLSKLAYYSIFFSVGVMYYRQRDNLHLHARFGKTYLFVAGLLFAAILPLIHEHLMVPFTGLRLALLAMLLALFACFTTSGLFALFLRTTRGENAATRYLAEASFWIYLIHLPFVTLTQIAVAQLPVPTMGKFLLAGATALALSLMTYHVFVRDTWLGAFLGGHRKFLCPVTAVPESVVISCPVGVPAYSSQTKLLTVGAFGTNLHTTN